MAMACAALGGCERLRDGDGLPPAPARTYLARTATILKTARADARPTFKVLFYGQSITSTEWTDRSSADLRRTYPNVNFVFANRAIGGNDAGLLERASQRDLDAAYPDLVVFHVYGDEHAYQRIVRTIRSHTAAELILQTDHARGPLEPVCPHGLRLEWRVPPGCTGHVWLHQRNWEDYMSGSVIPAMAAKYHAAIDPRRTLWAAYVARHGIDPVSLLRDGLHPNATGWRLAAALFDVAFNRLIAQTPVQPQRLVADHDVGRAGAVTLAFTGNRAEIVATAPLTGDYRAAIDGVAARATPGCWQVTRTSPVGWIPEWPAIRQVGIATQPLEADEWTAVLTDFSPDLNDFRFTLRSARHGVDGTGRGSADFVSPSHRVTIEAKDWAFGYAQRIKPQRPFGSMVVRWSRRFVCDRTSLVGPGAGPGEYRYVIATGLANGAHRLSLTLPPSDRALVRSVRTFRPPLL